MTKRCQTFAVARAKTLRPYLTARHVFLLGLFSVSALSLPGASSAEPAYVGSDACASCHEDAAATWKGSHHALAWTLPSQETIAADFDGTAFAHGGMRARFRIEGDAYYIAVTEKDGLTTEYRVHSVAGGEPLQQYLLETEPWRLQSFDVVWDAEAGGWFHLYPEQNLPPDDGLHWTGPYKNWNARCAECHATGYDKTYEARTRSYASTQAEIGVGCEACHGPGSEHLRWAEGLKIAETGVDLDAYGFSQSFDTVERTIQQCATCHSRREAHDDGSPVPGTPYHDSYGLVLLRPGVYHTDGQILDEVYVYGSFMQSKMYAAGVGCLDCHDAHSAEPVADGNAVCTQCHSPAGRTDFPTLRLAEYDTPAHHFHEPDTAGAECKSCHAPERVYMGIDWRADHSFRVPRPDISAETGAPDACTTSHSDRDAGWAAAEIAARFPDNTNRGPHYGIVLDRGHGDPIASAGDLAVLAIDTGQPGIVPATALWLAAQANSPATARQLEPLLADPDPQDRVLRLMPLLADPVRSVRVEAAKALLDAPIVRLPGAAQADLDAAMVKWNAAVASRLDFPETHLQIAGMALTMRAFPQAADAFREVVRLDPQRAEAWVMLVRLASALQGQDAARAVLDEALERNPGHPALLHQQ